MNEKAIELINNGLVNLPEQKNLYGAILCFKAAITELEKQPEPGEFTKELRSWFDIILKYGQSTQDQIKTIIKNVGLQGIEVRFTEARLVAKKGLEACTIIDRQAEEKRQKDAEILRLKARRISNSCVECAYLGGDCCGVLYSTVDGRVLCNECGREFDINLKDK